MTALVGRDLTAPLKTVGGKSARRRRLRSRVVVTQVALVVGALGLWQLAGNLGWINTFLFGSPVGTAQILWRWIQDGTLLVNTAVTLYEATVGFVIAVVIAIPLGIVLARSPFWDRVTEPFIDMANATPRFALAPIFVFMFGLGSMMKIALVITVVFFVILINTMAGTKAIEEDFIRLGRIAGANRRQLLARVVFPATGGYILAGLRLSVPYALAAAVVGEMFSGNSGLGYLVSNQAGLLIVNGVFAAVIVLALVGWGLNSLVRALLSRTPWARMASRAAG
ncbi:ABC transporter permease [Microbacterium aoyamense]|uniref:ABC transporter permease n=1 Tax=Microbacterium aoyamense TaxID=344166 RepID=A0ABP5B7L7_9MICO|nr:ABC transporter permease [Microbacterium aoyamense]